MFSFFAADLSAQNTALVKGYQAVQRGGIVFVSNNILSCVDCDEDVNQLPPGGTTDNNQKIGQYINIDSQPGIFSSSSADLILPDRSEITFAGLYWGGYLTSENHRYSERNNVKLKLPGAVNYMDVKAQVSFDPYDHNYQNFADITALVRDNGKTNGTFILANVVANTNNINLEAGWTIVIAYKNDLKPLRNLTVFHGLDGIIHGNNEELNLSVSGFVTPPAGRVSYELGVVAYEGDRGRNGDYMKFNGQFITDASRTYNNVFNSSITYHGAVVTTRNPAHGNTLGYDAGIILPENSLNSDGTYKYIQHNATEASIKVATSDDSYAVGVITTAIDIYDPNFEFNHTYTNMHSPGTPLKGGEKIQFEYDLKNIGNDQSKNTVVSAKVSSLLTGISNLKIQYNNDGNWLSLTSGRDEDQAEYIPGSDKINFRVGTGADALNGGAVLPNSALKIRFEGTLTSDPDLLSCSGSNFTSFGKIDYDGNLNSAQHFNQQSTSASVSGQNPLNNPLQINIEISPQDKMPLPDKNCTIVCNTKVSSLSLPDNYHLYAQSDSYFTAEVNVVASAGTYIARRVVAGGCEYKFNVHINITPITATLTKLHDVLTLESSTGAVAFMVNQPAGTYDQQWLRNGLPIITPVDLNALPEGTYQVLVTNSCQRVSTEKITISQPAEPLNVVSLTPETANVHEGKKISVSAQLLRPLETDLIITLSYSGKSQKDKDYVLPGQSQSILIPKGSLISKDKIILAALTDNIEEGNEEVVISIVSASNSLVQVGSGASITINDIYPPDILPAHTVKSFMAENTNLKADPLLSPNEDGSGNNFFKIDNIVSFPDNEVVIFNRFGAEVFRIKGYNESDRVFKGSPNKGNSPLPDGIYYFLITTNRHLDGQSISSLNKGYLILKR